MIVYEYLNPFDLSEGHIAHKVDGSLLLWMRERYRDDIVYVAVVVVAGAAVPPEQWDQHFDAPVYILVKPGDVATVVAYAWKAIQVISAAMAVYSFINRPKQNLPTEPSPTYSLGAQRNAARLGAGVPIHYGKVRVWPDLAAQPYTVYQNDDQYVFQLFCIGLGEFEFEALKIDDTDVAAYPEIQYAYYFDEEVKLFPTNVETSVEPANQELTVMPAYVGPYIANGSGTLATRLEVDFVWASGLFRVRGNGEIGTATMFLRAEYREVDGAGAPVGSWVEFVNTNITDSRQAPKRMTFGVDVDEGRYEVRVARGSPADEGPSIYTQCVWEGLRAFLVDDALVYEGVTVLAVKARATGNLNSESQRRFNVVATAKKPTWNGSTWSAPTATRAIADAFADAVRNEYIGNQPDANLDIETLYNLHDLWTERGDEFNFRFDVAVTLWEALQTIGKAGRAAPILNAEQVSIIRSTAQAAPITLFNRHNIIRGSFTMQYAFKNAESHDAIVAEYYDPAKGWVKAQVLCQPQGSAAANPRTVPYLGFTSREQAFREGMYDATIERLQGRVIQFDTELEGYIPNRGDMIRVAHEDFDLQQGGEVVAVSGFGLNYRLSEPVDWGDTSPRPAHSIYFRQENGDVDGPYLVTPGATAYDVVLALEPEEAPYVDGSQVRTLYALGVVGTTEGNWIVQEIAPKGDRRITITAACDVPEAHTADQAEIPADLDPNPLLVTPGAPVVRGLFVQNSGRPQDAIAARAPAPGALSYLVELRLNESPLRWVKLGETTNNYLEFPAPDERNVTVRVSGLGSVRGPYATWTGEVYTYIVNAPTDLSLTGVLALTTSGEYETILTFSFSPPPSDYHVWLFEAQYKFPRHNDVWQPLFYSKETSFESATTEVGTLHVRVRTVYVPGESVSDWAEITYESVGTYTAISAIGLQAPRNPRIYFTQRETDMAVRVECEFDLVTSPDSAKPGSAVVFYSTDDVPNQLPISVDAGDKLYIDRPGQLIEGTFDLQVRATGNTSTTVSYSDPQDIVDPDLSGVWWVAIIRSPSVFTKYHKITRVDGEKFYVNTADPFAFTPQSGDVVRVIEVQYHDSRTPEFSLLYIDGEVIRHEGINYDGQYYVQVAAGGRGAEGTTQADQSGKTANYYPAYGADTKFFTIPFAQFKVEDGLLKFSGDVAALLPAEFAWGAATIAFVRQGTAEEGVRYVRSNIVPLTTSGQA